MENGVNKLLNLEDEIKDILLEDIKSRDDDMYLYYLYCAKKYKELNKYFNVGDFCLIFVDKEFRKSLGIRTFGAVERCRRKIQEKNCALNSKMQVIKENEELIYEEYSRI